MRNIVLFFTLFMMIIFYQTSSLPLTLASTTWSDFVNKSELFAEATIVKAEYKNSVKYYTFELVNSYKGPAVSMITIQHNPLYDGPISDIGSTCFIALKKNNNKWVFALAGRSYWPVIHEQTTGLKSISRVGIDDHLIRNIPLLTRKKLTLVAWLANGKQHEYEAEVFLLDDVRKLLKAEFPK